MLAKSINAYWQGTAKILPQPFDPAGNAKEWVLQTGPGVIASHRLLPQVIEVLRAVAVTLPTWRRTPRSWPMIPNLEGQVVTPDGPTMGGRDSWRAGAQGVASQLTGDAARKRLAVPIQLHLPKRSITITL